jgi:EAL domain-containing protein (putative c-di-GMP-specific phosphodiesterase class I)
MGVSDLHIDDFYRDSAKILLMLYAQFPRKTTLYVEDIAGPDTPDEFGLHSPRHEACLHTMLWLANSHYLTFEQLVRQEALDQVVLSHRGFLALNSEIEPLPRIDESLPESLIKEERLAVHKIRQELKSGTSFSLAEAMRSFMRKSHDLGDNIKSVSKI